MSTIAGSMMTVVGVTFSMVLMVLAMASSQYTSRILRNFIRSRVTQVVLGIFAGIFTYCLIVLRTIRSGDEGAFVPNLAVSFGFVLALGGVGALIFFIHHIASSIQASSIIASVAEETIAAVDRLFPVNLGQGPGDDDDEQPLTPAVRAEVASCHGRARVAISKSVDNEALVRLARDRNTIVWMDHGIGEFVVQNTTLASLALEEPPDEATIDALQATFSISRHRMVDQDAAFGIRQIVDIALKALSPGINDTTTAIMCVDYLTSIMARIAQRQIPSSHRYEEGELRVIAKGPSFESLLAESFDQIRSNAKGDVAIMSRILGAFQTLASLTSNASRRLAIGEQVQWIAELAECSLESAHDRARIDTRLEGVRKALEAEPASGAGQDYKLTESAIQRWDNEGGHTRSPFQDAGKKELIVFDLDGTLTQSKSSLDTEMAGLLTSLLCIVQVAVISGGAWPQFEKQVLAKLPRHAQLQRLSILPTCGTKFYQFAADWKSIYSDDFDATEKAQITSAITQALNSTNTHVAKTWGEQIEDRGSQFTFSGLGQQAPIEEKEKWDPDFSKRKNIKAALEELIPNFSVNLGGTTSIDITKPGIDKGYGIRKLRDTLGVAIRDMIFIGDAIFPGGNDYPAKQAGALSICVRDPEETKHVVQAIIACLSESQTTTAERTS